MKGARYTVPRWRIDVARALAAAIGGLAGLGVVGTDRSVLVTTVAIAIGGVVGLVVALCTEWGARLRVEAHRLQGIERERDAEREQSQRLAKLLEHRAQVAQREAAINAVWTKVYSDAFMEAEANRRIPLEAILARVDVTMTAQNLKTPIEPLTL